MTRLFRPASSLDQVCFALTVIDLAVVMGMATILSSELLLLSEAIPWVSGIEFAVLFWGYWLLRVALSVGCGALVVRLAWPTGPQDWDTATAILEEEIGAPIRVHKGWNGAGRGG